MGTNISMNKGACLSEEALLALAENRLPHAEEALAHIAHCPLCADALEGIRFMENPQQLPAVVAALNKRVAAKASGGGAGSPRMRTLWPVAAAVAACLVVGLFALWQLPGGASEMGMNEEKVATQAPEVHDTLASEDAVAQSLHTEEAKPIPQKSKPAKIEATKPHRQPKPAPLAEEPVYAKDLKPEKEEPEKEEVADLADAEEPVAAPAPQADALGAQRAMEQRQKMSQGDGGGEFPAMKLSIYQSPLLSAQQNQVFGHAQLSFNAAKFKEAEHLYAQLLEEVPNSLEVNYLAGLNFLYQNNAKEAMRRFKAVARSSDAPDFSADLDWRRLIAHLENQEISAAQDYLSAYRLAGGKLERK